MFVLRLLGAAVVEGPDGPLAGRLSQRRRLALLALLALARGRTVSRDRLLGILWPESDAERARHSLADSIYQIRRELGDNAVLSAGEDVRLNGDVIGSDVGELEAALEGRDLERAVALYAGPLLDGFHLSDAPEFERWAEEERARLARAYAGALEQLATAAGARGAASAAVEWWRRLAAVDPYSARVTLRLMEALEAAGNRAGAIQQARIHSTLMREEFAAEPDPAVATLADRLRLQPIDSPARSESIRATAHTPPLESTEPSSVTRRRVGWRAAALVAAAAVIVVLISLGRFLPNGRARAATVPAASGADNKTIAILPCANLSGNPEEEYVSDGLTEELTGVLAKVKTLRVVARTSAFAFKGANRDVRRIGEALNAGTVVECSVRRAGERVRVTAQLIDARDGMHIWAESYDREGTDIFAIQSDLALRIAGALEAALTPAERERMARRPTANGEAHALYLKGKYFLNKRTRSGFDLAVGYFQRAVAIDSQYAAAYAGLARTYSLLGLFGMVPARVARERMRAAVLRAVALDDNLAAAQGELGAFHHLYEWDTPAAERAYLRALELDPSYATAHHLYGNFLRAMGRYAEALTHKRLAVELDPLDPTMNYTLGQTLMSAGRQNEALASFRSALELDSTSALGHEGLGEFYAATGRYEEAIRAYRTAARFGDVDAKAGLARALANAGQTTEARQLLAQLERDALGAETYPPSIAAARLALGDVEGALEWLDRAYDQRQPRLRLLDQAPFARLAGDPRYRSLLQRVGLPPLP